MYLQVNIHTMAPPCFSELNTYLNLSSPLSLLLSMSMVTVYRLAHDMPSLGSYLNPHAAKLIVMPAHG